MQDCGAIAAVIIDDGQCDDEFNCGYPLGSRSDGRGIGWQDVSTAWDEIHILVLILERHGRALKRVMKLQSMNIPGLGTQYFDRE